MLYQYITLGVQGCSVDLLVLKLLTDLFYEHLCFKVPPLDTELLVYDGSPVYTVYAPVVTHCTWSLLSGGHSSRQIVLYPDGTLVSKYLQRGATESWTSLLSQSLQPCDGQCKLCKKQIGHLAKLAALHSQKRNLASKNTDITIHI